MASSESSEVLFLVPGNPEQKTGGYRYVNRLVSALCDLGLQARVEGLEGQFPIPDASSERGMGSALDRCADDALVVLDGLAMGAMPHVLQKHYRRLKLWSLVHHPLADETGLDSATVDFLTDAETRALALMDGVLVTSRHTAERLSAFQVPTAKIFVVEPGADTVRTEQSEPSEQNEQNEKSAAVVREDSEPPRLLSVATLSPRKAQHQLVEALADLQHLPWQCTLVGSTEREPGYAKALKQQIEQLNLNDRIKLAGELEDESLAEQYQQADCFVLPSLYEGYGMVVDEALSAGLPVICSNGGALASTGNRSGVQLYEAGSVNDLRTALESHLASDRPFADLGRHALQSAGSLRQWADAAVACAGALSLTLPETDHSQFDAEWLALREPADHQARNRELVSQVQTWAVERAKHSSTDSSTDSARERALNVVDLGAGAGSNGIYMSGVLSGEQHWTLLDQDAGLLDLAESRLADHHRTDQSLTVEKRRCRLDTEKLDAVIPEPADLLTASALIDLVSKDWLEGLALVARNRNAGVYIVLSYAGEFQLSPEHPDDELIRTLVNDHQHGDKGSGAAMGPEATDSLRRALEAQGYRVSTGSSPWQLDGDKQALQAALIRGWSEAALEQCPAEASRIRRWQADRLDARLSIRVEHMDLFARPVND